mgnify:CR=1 FL=1
MAERITSRANPLMAHIRRLASSRSSRYEAGEYLGDGSRRGFVVLVRTALFSIGP